ncbi:hypothetical protein KTS45_17585 [Halomicroarcula limicola]|uniref:Uncharacterized protein n=1 Tax=Haloarcula limicola TaxID=1429915 RepID=A0A8J7YD16_9EURY|nr:hypothetical protein [Halomicroarcula limicola]MBV0926019.1 hypothetical protein [Halomicroarcula limicola]
MVTPLGVGYIVAVTVLFFLWIYGLVSLYFDVRHKFLPRLYSWLRQRRADPRHLM